MRAEDGESACRVDRHRRMRAGKGFDTVECPVDLAGAQIPPDCAVLLEDLSNLAANEYFSPCGEAGAFHRILSGVDHVAAQAALLVVVSNEIFSDGAEWTGDMDRYVRGLGRLNQALAARAETVVEVVCGIPVYHKGGGR